MTSRIRARRRRPRLVALPRSQAPGAPVATAVFEQPGPASRLHAWLAWAAAALYGGLAAWAVLAPPSPAVATPGPPPMEVTLFEAPRPSPPSAPEPPPPPTRPRAARVAPPVPSAGPAAATPAQAAEVVAQEARPEEPLDLTGFSIATGAATSYAGGKTASSGTSTRAVTGAVSAEGVPGETGTGPADLRRPVGLAADEWDCPWPAEADALGIDEQTVVIRVTVRADGRFESAELVRDPGNGFGTEALRCAPLNRFQPALDRTGRPTRARSGPIRVRFTR